MLASAECDCSGLCLFLADLIKSIGTTVGEPARFSVLSVAKVGITLYWCCSQGCGAVCKEGFPQPGPCLAVCQVVHS